VVRRVDPRLDELDHEVARRLLNRFVPWLLGTLVLSGCREAAAPQLSYLAILPTILAPQSTIAGSHYHYRVHELSGQLPIDTIVSVAPTDTVILPLPAATYVVDLDGVPPQCRVRDGNERYVLIAPNTNTTALRYFVVCQSQLLLAVFTDGPEAGLEFVYHVADAAGRERVGLLRANDTLELEGLAWGPATIDLGNVPARCITTNDGGSQRHVQIDSGGGVEVDFRVRCADPVHRPHIQSLHASYHDGIAGIVFKASDPDRDLERYVWDVTDCDRTSVLPQGAGTRGGLGAGRTANFDTMTVLATFDIGLPDSIMKGKCVALWLADTQANPSEVVEVPFGGSGHAPDASIFNAHFLGTDILRTDLVAKDLDGDFVGVFVQVRLRDGTLGAPDGTEDIAYFNTVGYLGSAVPDVPLGNGRLTYDSFYAIIVYLLDAQGNFTRIEDADLFR
jgi:hypothetical protein